MFFKPLWLVPKGKKNTIFTGPTTTTTPTPVLLINWISLGPRGPFSTSRDVPVCSVNQWFPREACLTLFKLSVRSPEANLKSADKLLTPPLPSHICFSWHIPDLLWAHVFKHAQRYFYVQINLVGVLQFVSEISGERRSICYVCCPSTVLKHVLFGSVIMAVLILLHSQQHCTLIKDSFKFKVCPKPQATHFPLG